MLSITRSLVLSTALITSFATPALAQVVQAPTLTVVAPQAGQTLYGDKIPVLLAVEGLTITDYKANASPVVGQGHIHLWLDDQNPTPESAIKVIDDNFTFSDVPPGDHTLKAEVVGNNHAPLTPPVVTTVEFKSAPVGTPAPAPQPSFDRNTAAVILVVVALVIVAAWWYTKEDDEQLPKAETKSAKPKTKRTTAKKKTSAKRRK